MRFQTFITITTMTILSATTRAYSMPVEEWTLENNQWTYERDGVPVENEWVTDIDGDTYYIGKGGVPVSGWVSVGKDSYYLNSEHDGTYGVVLEDGASIRSDEKIVQIKTDEDGKLTEETKGVLDVFLDPLEVAAMPQENNRVKIACIGDSITYGVGLEDRYSEQWPVLLNEKLGEGYEIKNYGVPNASLHNDSFLPYSSTKKYQNSLKSDPDLCIIMLGTNDAKDQNWHGIGEFRSKLLDLISQYKSLASNPEIVLLSPCTAYNPILKSGETDPVKILALRNTIESAASELGCRFIDITTFTNGHEDWFDSDGIHPNKTGAEKISEYLYQNLRFG